MTNLEDVVAKADSQFKRREFGRALETIAEVPELLQARADLLEIKARSYQALGRPLDAIAAWEQILRIEPANKTAQSQIPACYATLGREEVFKDVHAQLRQNKFRDALTALEAGPPEWQRHPEYHRLQARCLERVNDYGSALAAWQQRARAQSADAEALVHIGICHAAVGDMEQAERAFKTAVDRFPRNMFAQFEWLFFRLKQQGALRETSALIAELQRLEALSDTPASFNVQLDVLRTRLLSLDDVGELLALEIEKGIRSSAASGKGESLRSIYERFEPVGNDCEFGFAQRKHGAEPLSLLRWTSITPENLIRLLNDRFEQFEALERYRIEQGPGGEFILKESTYHTSSHTMIKTLMRMARSHCNSCAAGRRFSSASSSKRQPKAPRSSCTSSTSA